MTRNPIAALALAASFSLAGCATTSGPGSVGDIIAQVQQAARAACGFLPAVDTVSAILNNGVLTTADSIANAICAAVAPPSTSRSLARAAVSRTPMVGSVVVRGTWVK